MKPPIPLGMLHDARYLPPLKAGGYGFPARLSGFRRAIERNRKIDRQVYQAIDRGVRPAARQKIINLIRKVRKKTGKTYYQRAQIAAARQSPKGGNFSYRPIYRSIYR